VYWKNKFKQYDAQSIFTEGFVNKNYFHLIYRKTKYKFNSLGDHFAIQIWMLKKLLKRVARKLRGTDSFQQQIRDIPGRLIYIN